MKRGRLVGRFYGIFVGERSETKPIRSVSTTYGTRLVLARVRLDFRLSLQKTLSLRGGGLIPTRRDRKRRYKFWPSYPPDKPTPLSLSLSLSFPLYLPLPPCRLPRIVAKSKKSSYISMVALSLGSRSSSVHKVLPRRFHPRRDETEFTTRANLRSRLRLISKRIRNGDRNRARQLTSCAGTTCRARRHFFLFQNCNIFSVSSIFK